MSVFGELNITSSRAVSDDEDDELAIENEEQLLSKKQLHWFDCVSNQNSINVKQLILASDPVSSAFVYSYLLNHYESKQLVGMISTNTQFNIESKHLNEERNNNKYKRPTNSLNYLNYIFSLNINQQSFLIVLCYDEIKSNEIYDLTSQLVSKVNFGNAIILTSQHRANFYGVDHAKLPTIRYLCSESNVNITWCDRLEEPNFITGLPAAVMNICIALKKPALTYICFKNSVEIDINSVKEFYNVLSKSSHNIYIDDQLTKDRLLSLTNKITTVAGLYT